MKNKINYSKRAIIKSSLISSLIGFFQPIIKVSANNAYTDNTVRKATLNFTSITISQQDEILLPKGFKYQVITSWGDKLYKHSPKFEFGNNSSAAQLLQIGENHDGMNFFKINSAQAILAVNHEYNNYEYLFAPNNDEKNYLLPWSMEKVKKAQNAVGVSIIQIDYDKNKKTWKVNLDSHFNTKYHANSIMRFSGPAAGNKNLQNSYDKLGYKCLGTMANCSTGKTPWGTYLTCEENFDGYFIANSNFIPHELQLRYGIGKNNFNCKWHEFDERFDLAKNNNEANCFGWIVEINPYNKNFTPIKHTALGRFKHENIAIKCQEGHPLVAYMGDDEAGEYIYKYISTKKYYAKNGLANSSLLTDGKLYVAKFNNDNSGEWLELNLNTIINNPKNKYIKTAQDILIYTRYAADLLQPTTMDRPEWVAINSSNTVYATLTNNKNRGTKHPINKANPRGNNIYGHIIRWTDHDMSQYQSNKFTWNIFILAANKNDKNNQQVLFNGPDCIAFDKFDNLWIGTDGNTSNSKDFAGHGNNQLLFANTKTKEIKRFMTAPKGSEITGVCFSDDGNTLFVNIQHPGEIDADLLPLKEGQSKNDFIARNTLYVSSWPQVLGNTDKIKSPRSSTIAIQLYSS